MALADEIAVKLGLNATEFKAALRAANADVTNFKGAASGPTAVGNAFDGLAKKIGGLKALGGAVAVALGLNFQALADKIARMWIDFSEAQEEALKAAIEANDKAADAAEKRRDDAAKREDERIQRVSDAQVKTWDVVRDFRLKLMEDIAEEEEKKRKESFEEDLKWYKQRTSLEEKLHEQKLESMSLEDRIAARAKDIAGLKAQQKQHEKDSNEYLALQVQINEQNVILEKERKEYVEGTAKAEKQITDEKQRQRLEAKALGDSLMESTLRVGDRLFGPAVSQDRIDRASVAELKELIRRTKLDMQFVESQKGVGPTALADAANNYLIQGSVLARLQTTIQRASQVIIARNRLQQQIDFLGSDTARERYAGDPLNYDRAVSQLAEKQSEGTKLLQSLDDRLSTAGFARR